MHVVLLRLAKKINQAPLSKTNAKPDFVQMVALNEVDTAKHD
jgi:hypothetical protein